MAIIARDPMIVRMVHLFALIIASREWTELILNATKACHICSVVNFSSPYVFCPALILSFNPVILLNGSLSAFIPFFNAAYVQIHIMNCLSL